MNTAVSVETAARGGTSRSSQSGFRAYFASDTIRTVQSVLGLIWLLDGALQFQSFMYSKAFTQGLVGMAAGQPSWLARSLTWSAHTAQHHLGVWNTLFALVQVSIGLGLLLKQTVKPALALSFAWALVVWWFGEAFGMLFMNMANPLTGAPGAVLLYALIGLMVWPNGRPGGLLGVLGSRLTWGILWIGMGLLWLTEVSSSGNATHDAIQAAPTNWNWYQHMDNHIANATRGDGLVIALICAALSIAVGLAVAFNWRAKEFLILAIVMNVVYWLFGQAFGGLFTGSATDPNSGPLFIVMACTLYSLRRFRVQATVTAETASGDLAAA